MARPNKKAGVNPKKAGVAAAILLIISAVFAVEGGYVNHPNDPGGATNHGVTERVARNAGFKDDMRLLPRNCNFEGEVCASSIYYEGYIKGPGFLPLVEIDPVVAEEVIDTAVNMGPRRPSRFFQRAINDNCNTSLAVDGRIGPMTVKAWRDCRQNLGSKVCVKMLDNLDAQQEREYDRLVRRNPRLRVFRKGWQNHRIGNVDRALCKSGWMKAVDDKNAA
jgi:lysozyme family protein